MGTKAFLLATGPLVLALVLPGSSTAQTANSSSRLANGKPDLNGIWQALNEANYDVEAHVARPAMALRAGSRFFTAISGPSRGSVFAPSLDHPRYSDFHQSFRTVDTNSDKSGGALGSVSHKANAPHKADRWVAESSADPAPWAADPLANQSFHSHDTMAFSGS